MRSSLPKLNIKSLSKLLHAVCSNSDTVKKMHLNFHHVRVVLAKSQDEPHYKPRIRQNFTLLEDAIKILRASAAVAVIDSSMFGDGGRIKRIDRGDITTCRIGR